MKIAALTLSAFLASAHGFSAKPFAATRRPARASISTLRMSDAKDEVAALRAAAAKAREDAARLSQVCIVFLC
jgi:hypothetical protein